MQEVIGMEGMGVRRYTVIKTPPKFLMIDPTDWGYQAPCYLVLSYPSLDRCLLQVPTD